MPFRSKLARTMVSAAIVFAGRQLGVTDAAAQGCVVARQSVPVVSPAMMTQSIDVCEGESWYSPRRWSVATGYRYFHSHRHFVGTVEQVNRAEQRTEVNNIVNLLDFAVSYQVNARWSVNAGVPLLLSERYNQRTPDQKTYGRGLGDTSVSARMWVVRPPTESRQNLSFGFGVKLPTGEYGQTNTVTTATGTRTVVIDQSIQPGDGGYGLSLDAQGYKSISFLTIYGSGIYLFNPRNTNGVMTGRGRASESIMSVPDQYLYRFGGIVPVPRIRPLTASMGIRAEGIPVRDAFGKSDGFRRPGLILDIDPGLMLSLGENTFSLNVPVPFRRERTRSTSDIIDNRHGDAAFADYVVLVGFSRRF